MADRVEIAFRRTLDVRVPDGAALLVAVSGGADSVALLHLLHRCAARRELRLCVAHLDHGLRRGSRTDRRFVERMARALGLDCHSARLEVGSLRRRDESLEEASRRVRRAFLIDRARVAGATVATGHTLDDQAETILMRWVRGAGARALAGIRASGPGPFVRPLLEIERADLRALLGRRGIPFREDASNRDLRFDRNRVRRLILPELTDQLNPRAARQIVQAAGRLREDAEYLDRLARSQFEALRRRGSRGELVFEQGALDGLPAALAGRVACIALQEAGVDARRIGTRQIEALLDLDRGRRGRSIDLPGRLTAKSQRGRLRIGPPGTTARAGPRDVC